MIRRVRLRFAKHGRVRFTSHRDVARIFERSVRKAGVPVAYSEGYSPRPRLRFGLALPTGYESRAEYLALDLAEDLAPCDLARRVDAALPPGMEVMAADEAPPGAPSLQEAVTSCTWLLELPGVSADNAEELIDATVAADQLEITRERKGKVRRDDVRPAVLALALAAPVEAGSLTWTPDGALVEAELATQPRSCRPRELLAAMGGLEESRVIRTHQWIQSGAERCEPLPIASSPDTLAERRAS